MNRILIEPMLFGDYCVAIYDERNELLLDRKYFTAGLISARFVVGELLQREEWKDLPVYICDPSKKEYTEILLKDFN